MFLLFVLLLLLVAPLNECTSAHCFFELHAVHIDALAQAAAAAAVVFADHGLFCYFLA